MVDAETSNQKKKFKHGGARPNSGGARPGAGRKPYVFTEKEREQVEILSGYGIPYEQIAILIRDGIDVVTLMKYFKKELLAGKAKANSNVAKTLYQKAIDGDTASAIWWSKAQLRWSETNKHEHTGKDGEPLSMASIDLSKLSTETLRELVAAKDAAQ